MEIWEVVLIVFGSSALIMFVLIVMFKWMSIKILRCCCCRHGGSGENAYKVDSGSSQQDIECKAAAVADSLCYIIDKSGYSSSYTYNERSNRVSVDTHETCDEDFPHNFNNDSMVVHVKPVLKQTTRCSLDLSGETSIDSDLKVDAPKAEAQIEINYNPFQEILEFKMLKIIHLSLDRMFVNDEGGIDTSRNDDLNIISASQLFHVYYVLWLSDLQMEKKVSKIKAFSSQLDLNDEYKWFFDEASLMHAQVNLVVYIINNTNGFQQPIAQTSLKIHDIYAHKPTRTWLSLNEPDQEPIYKGDVLVSLSYLPTAERLTVIVVESRNLQFENKALIGSSYAKISLLNEKGRMLESFVTSIRKDDPNPQFNEVTIFNVKSSEFNRIYLKVTLFEIKNNNQHLRIGHSFIGPNSLNGHWQNVLKQVRRQVAMWHHLIE